MISVQPSVDRVEMLSIENPKNASLKIVLIFEDPGKDIC